MKVLFIGGTGTISTAVSHLCVARGLDLYLLNRGERGVEIPGTKAIRADFHQEDATAAALAGLSFDVVVDWIAYSPDDIERDLRLFSGRTGQFVFISSASCYQKPLLNPIVTESTPLRNPFWNYSRQKIACEDRLLRAYRDDAFPVTIVRPSHTYDKGLPSSFGGGFTMIDRMRRGLPIIVHGDGTSLWTLTHSEDFAKGFVGLLGNDYAIGHAFHITSDEALTWDQIHRTVAAAAGVEARLVHIPSEFLARMEPNLEGSLIGDKATSVIFDNSKIKRYVPGYQAAIPFREGARRALAWIEADPSRMKVDPAANETIERILAAYGHAA